MQHCSRLFISLCLLASLCAFPAFAQNILYRPVQQAPIVGGADEVLPQLENEAPARIPVPNMDETLGLLYEAGSTYYDYQHNGSAGKMIGVDALGFVHVVWTKSFGPLSAIRHAYYNAWDPATQGFLFNNASSGVPVETSLRGGFATQAVSPSGWAFPVSHTLRAGLDSREHAEGAMDTQPSGGIFSWSRPTPFTQSGQPLELIWPKVALSSDSTLHMVTTENPRGIAPNTPRRIFYSRGVPEWNAGQGVRVNWQNVDGPRQFLGLGTSQTVSADVAASKTSQRVAVAWTQSRDNLSQYNNDVYLRISEDGGLTWQEGINLTAFTAADTLRAYTDVSVLFDENDVLHVAFTTGYLNEAAGVMNAAYSLIWHWDEQHEQFSLLANGWFGAVNHELGAWQRMAQRPSLSQDPITGHLYCSYQQYDTTAWSQRGYLMSDAFVTVSTNGGLSWARGTNVTQTRPARIPAPWGYSLSERDITLADRITYAAGEGFAHLEYTLDRDAGSLAQCEGYNTSNTVYYQRVPVNRIATGPILTPLRMHVDLPPVTGRCCYGPAETPACGQLTAAACAQLNGMWNVSATCGDPCPATIPVCACPDQPATHCADAALAIPDANSAGVALTITVPVQYHILDVNLCLDITHPSVADLRLTLTSPSGVTVPLTAWQGTGANFRCTTLDDDAADSLHTGTAPYTGAYRVAGRLADFDLQNARGNWTLRVYDDIAGQSGTVNWACLTFEYDVVLAVELTSFTATGVGGGVRIDFATASERDNARFEIMRASSQNGSYTRLAVLPSQGTATSGHAYHYLDATAEPEQGYWYYLADISQTGARFEHRHRAQAASSPTASLPHDYTLSAYPNPFNPLTTLTFALPEAGRVLLAVYDVSGREVARMADRAFDAGAHRLTFDAGHLPTGVYFARLQSGAFTRTQKLLLLK